MFSISFVVVVVRSRLIGFDRNLEEAAADLGATPLATFRTVTLPLLAPGILAAALLAFALSIDDFVISNFNSGTTVTFPLYVYGVSLRGIPVQVNVLATMLFVVTVIAGRAGALQQRRAERMAAVRPEPKRLRTPSQRRGDVHERTARPSARLATTSAASGARRDGRRRRSTTSTRRRGEVAALVPLSGRGAGARGGRGGAGGAARLARRCRRSGGRGRCWPCARSCCAGREELVALVSADMGKTLADADGEVGRGIESVESAAAIPHLLKGETLEGVAAGVDVEMVRQPVGVVAAITPFNFPAMIPLWFLPYAIACGNAFILKPSEQDPRPAALIVEIVDCDRGDPRRRRQPRPRRARRGHGDARGPGHRRDLLRRPRGDGADRRRRRGRGTGKRVQALGGAKNSLVVMPDADLEQAMPAIMGSAFGAAGQRCLAGLGLRRRRRRGAAGARCARRWSPPPRSWRSAPGDEPGTDVCPMVSAAAREKVAEAIGRAADDGAELLLDGRGDAGPAGTLLGPTIAVADDPSRELARDELFGPLLTVVEVDRPRRSARVPQRLALRQRRRDLHPLRRGAPASTATAPRPGCSASTSASPPRSPGSPSAGWKDSMRRRPARQRHRRGRLLHPQEGRHQPLVISGRCGSRSARGCVLGPG